LKQTQQEKQSKIEQTLHHNYATHRKKKATRKLLKLKGGSIFTFS